MITNICYFAFIEHIPSEASRLEIQTNNESQSNKAATNKNNKHIKQLNHNNLTANHN